jgi:hypothetical protein
MSKANDFLRAIKQVSLGNLIEDVRAITKDNVMTIRAMDRTQSIFVDTKADVEIEDSDLGLTVLSVLSKYLNLVKDNDVVITLDDNYLCFKTDTSEVKYLLTEPDAISSYEEGWGDIEDAIELQIEEGGYEEPLQLKQEKISEFITLMGLFAPNVVTIQVGKRGDVILHGGKESDHQFDVNIGKIKATGSFSVKVYGKNFDEILSVLDLNEECFLYIAPEQDVIIKTNQTGWVIKPLDIDE